MESFFRVLIRLSFGQNYENKETSFFEANLNKNYILRFLSTILAVGIYLFIVKVQVKRRSLEENVENSKLVNATSCCAFCYAT